MMMHDQSHSDEIIKLVEEQLGRDLESKIVKELKEHLELCPDCRIFVDSVRQTVKLYRVSEEDTTIPSDVSDRLFKVLKLELDK